MERILAGRNHPADRPAPTSSENRVLSQHRYLWILLTYLLLLLTEHTSKIHLAAAPGCTAIRESALLSAWYSPLARRIVGSRRIGLGFLRKGHLNFTIIRNGDDTTRPCCNSSLHGIFPLQVGGQLLTGAEIARRGNFHDGSMIITLTQ